MSTIVDTSTQAARYYQPSGKIHPLSVLLPIPLTAVILLGLAWIYAWLCIINPFVYISFIATLVYGAASGIIAGALLDQFKSRSALFSTLSGVIVGLLAVWFAWVMWAGDTGYGDPRFSALPFLDRLLLGPIAAFNYAFDGLSDYYQLSIGRRSSSAGLDSGTMELIWWIELALIVLVTTFCTFVASGMGAFNEETGNKAKNALETYARLNADSPDMSDAAIAHNSDAFLALDAIEGDPSAEGLYLKIQLENDSEDANFNLLSLSHVKAALNDKEELETKSDETCKRLYVSQDFAQKLLNRFGG